MDLLLIHRRAAVDPTTRSCKLYNVQPRTKENVKVYFIIESILAVLDGELPTGFVSPQMRPF